MKPNWTGEKILDNETCHDDDVDVYASVCFWSFPAALSDVELDNFIKKNKIFASEEHGTIALTPIIKRSCRRTLIKQTIYG